MSSVNPAHLGAYRPHSQQPPAAVTTAKRPGSVTAAVVIAVFMAAVQVFVGLMLTSLEASSGALAFLGVLNLVSAGFLVWGAIAALKGWTSKILAFTALAIAIINAISMIIAVAIDAANPAGVLSVILPAVMFFNLRTAESKQFFMSRGGTAL